MKPSMSLIQSISREIFVGLLVEAVVAVITYFLSETKWRIFVLVVGTMIAGFLAFPEIKWQIFILLAFIVVFVFALFLFKMRKAGKTRTFDKVPAGPQVNKDDIIDKIYRLPQNVYDSLIFIVLTNRQRTMFIEEYPDKNRVGFVDFVERIGKLNELAKRLEEYGRESYDKSIREENGRDMAWLVLVAVLVIAAVIIRPHITTSKDLKPPTLPPLLTPTKSVRSHLSGKEIAFVSDRSGEAHVFLGVIQDGKISNVREVPPPTGFYRTEWPSWCDSLLAYEAQDLEESKIWVYVRDTERDLPDIRIDMPPGYNIINAGVPHCLSSSPLTLAFSFITPQF